MIILVINCGSSSLKYQFFDMQNEAVIFSGSVERIGEEKSSISHSWQRGGQIHHDAAIADHRSAFA